MGKRKNIEIPIPNWTWWQTALFVGIIIIALKLNPVMVLKAIKEVILIWLSG
jgi:hypothetical protein